MVELPTLAGVEDGIDSPWQLLDITLQYFRDSTSTFLGKGVSFRNPLFSDTI